MQRRRIQKNIFIFSALFIPMVLLFTFTYYASGRLLQLSFTSWNGISRDIEYVGFQNYIEILTNPENFKVFAHNFAYLVMGIVQSRSSAASDVYKRQIKQ